MNRGIPGVQLREADIPARAGCALLPALDYRKQKPYDADPEEIP
jgi:hypothetical protein